PSLIQAADEASLSCLLWHGNGCEAILSEQLCVRSRDGRPTGDSGQPCAWLGAGRDRFCVRLGQVPPSSSSLPLQKYVAASCKEGSTLEDTIAEIVPPARESSSVVASPAGDEVARMPWDAVDLEAVDGAKDRACRGVVPAQTGYTSRTYNVWTAENLGQCKGLCTGSCQGVEYHGSGKYCEVWFGQVLFSANASGYECYARGDQSQAAKLALLRPQATACLKPKGGGCGATSDRFICLSSVDGRSISDIDGLKVRGEACVWCGGLNCHSDSDSKCEPFDYLLRGPQKDMSFGELEHRFFEVASCVGQVPKVYIPAPASWRPEPPSAAALALLTPVPDGCRSLRTMGECLVSKDGSSVQKVEEYKVKGQACVWCGGGPCTSADDAQCAAFDFVMTGEGRAFSIFLGKNDFRVAKITGPKFTLDPGKGTSCLSAANQGCQTLADEYGCLSSADAWMGVLKTGLEGGKCEMNGEGTVFVSNYAKDSYSVASCEPDGLLTVHLPVGQQSPTAPAPSLTHPGDEALKCLSYEANGCFAIRDQLSCLSHLDGSAENNFGGLKIHGQPCVWCGGGLCTSTANFSCAPLDYLMRGAGRAFPFLGSGDFLVAKCSGSDISTGDLSCLKPFVEGCNHIQDRDTCTSSTDGRPYKYIAGFKVAGQPCVWCGGGACHSGSVALCEPFDFLVNGEGRAFTSAFRPAGLREAAACQSGQILPFALAHPDGIPSLIECGRGPRQIWNKVGSTCSSCTVLVPKIADLFSTCQDYCAHQPGGLNCVGASLAQPHSCDVASVENCDHAFGESENAVCQCAPHQVLWAQCGGKDWKGATQCDIGAECRNFNDFYSQCVPPGSEVRPVSINEVEAEGTLGVAPPSSAEVAVATPKPLWKVDRPEESQMKCLTSESLGCGSIRNKLICLSRKDGRTGYSDHGLKMGGEPCVWCGGGLCTSNNDDVCEPYDWLVNGEGTAFNTLHARGSYEIAQCHDGRDSMFDNQECLEKAVSGCNSITDMGTCLASVDGRPYDTIAGLKIAGQPCVWCGGVACVVGSDSVCEPYDYVVNGAGHAFSNFHAQATYMVARCEQGHPMSHSEPDAIAAKGQTKQVNCGNPMPFWSKVGRNCGECRVLVPKIRNQFETCTAYCGQQPGSLACSEAAVTYSLSCDVQRKAQCDYIFQAGESALCHCDPSKKLLSPSTDALAETHAALGVAPPSSAVVAVATPKPWWKHDRPEESQMKCLTSESLGCGSIRNKLTCLSSKDGRTGYSDHGLKMGGEPCAWCDGGLCTSNNDDVCEPYDWLVNGEGTAFNTLHARGSYEIAQCHDGRDSIFDNQECLEKAVSGCNSITDMGTCLASVDGRPYDTIAGFKIAGQPCVWCGGVACVVGSDSVCEPYDYVVNGAGQAFSNFQAQATYMVARCEQGHPMSHSEPDAVVARGQMKRVNCGNPIPFWSKVGQTCGQCQVMVPNIRDQFETCTAYCGQQPGSLACSEAAVTYSLSCDVQRKAQCDYIFQAGESALCHCNPVRLGMEDHFAAAMIVPSISTGHVSAQDVAHKLVATDYRNPAGRVVFGWPPPVVVVGWGLAVAASFAAVALSCLSQPTPERTQSRQPQFVYSRVQSSEIEFQEHLAVDSVDSAA
ncbi:unnamed protein product, partial [Polarella glacialis]